MSPANFPLRWESIGNQWWFASPIDWAAANGLYDLVRQLLHLDPNLLIKLTSLRRIRRLETVWDDESQFDNVAKCRSLIAQKLLLESEGNPNSLIRAGYGGWLLYTAASAGDVGFVKELLERDPLLVFGEGEYGITDIFYAAARSKSSEVFRLLLDSSLYVRRTAGESDDVSLVFKWELMNRGVHAAARGGNLEMLKELLVDCSDVLVYRDSQGSTLLHTASGRGQVEVVEYLVQSFDIIASTDNQGNTALHVASYKGYLPIVQMLISNSPSLASLANYDGNTFLHMAVSGFRTPSFRRLDRQIELINALVSGKIANMDDIINAANDEGRTPLHMAIVENVQSDVVELLLNVPSIDLNTRDADGMAPLDLLNQRPRSASSEMLKRQLISAGGFSGCSKSTSVSFFKVQGIGSSPGASFRIPDAEIFLHIGIEDESESSNEFSEVGLNLSGNKKPRSVNYAARRLRALLQWPRRKERKSESLASDEDSSLESYDICRYSEFFHTPLRERFSGLSSLPSPSTRKKYAAGLMRGVIQVMPKNDFALNSGRGVRIQRQGSLNKRMMNQYFCFGAQGLAVEDSVRRTRSVLRLDP